MVSTGKRSTPRFASESPHNKIREGLADWRSEYISFFLSFLISRHGASDNSCKAFLEKTGPRIDFFHGKTNYIQDTMGERRGRSWRTCVMYIQYALETDINR